jgi:hypothetical protein
VELNDNSRPTFQRRVTGVGQVSQKKDMKINIILIGSASDRSPFDYIIINGRITQNGFQRNTF